MNQRQSTFEPKSIPPPLLSPCISFSRKMFINPYIYIYAVTLIHTHSLTRSLTARRTQNSYAMHRRRRRLSYLPY